MSKRVIKGKNDLWTTHKELALLLNNKENGYTVSFGSHKVLEWICPNCKNIIIRSVNEVHNHGLSCKLCSDGISFSEKYIASLLSQLNLSFKRECVFNWSKHKRYDFYIPKLSLIIETNGIQHYKDNVFSRSLEEETKNDFIKKELALKNGIKYYIQLDCRISDSKFIYNSLRNSKLSNLLDFENIDWNKCEVDALNSISSKILKLWNEGIYDIGKISYILNISKTCVYKYIKIFKKNNLCDYNPQKRHTDSNIRYLGKKVRCIETGKIYNSIGETRNDGFIPQNVSACCNGKVKTHKKFHWEFYKEVS